MPGSTLRAHDRDEQVGTGRSSDWLTREQIDAIIDGMSAADLLEAIGDGTTVKGAKMLGTAFDAAASRAGFSNGTSATEHVRIRDFKYLADELGKVVSVENPTSGS